MVHNMLRKEIFLFAIYFWWPDRKAVDSSSFLLKQTDRLDLKDEAHAVIRQS